MPWQLGTSQLGTTTVLGDSDTDFPDVRVEIAFGANPLDPDPAWSDVSQYARGLDISRGRQREADQFQVGRLSVLLDNATRTFDRTYTSGPFYPNIRPMKRIRVWAAYNGTVYHQFDGYIDSWNLDYIDTREAVVVVEASDAFKVLNGHALPTGAYANEIANAGPIAWWRMDDAATATDARDVVGGLRLTKQSGSGVTAAQTSLLARDSNTATKIVDDGAGTTRDGFQRFGSPVLTGRPLSLEMVFQYLGPNKGNLFVETTSNGQEGAKLNVNISGEVEFITATASGGTSTLLSTTVLVANSTYHIAGVWESDNTTRLYINGSLEDSGALTGGPFATGDHYMIIGGGTGVANCDGVYDEIAVYDRALSAAEVAAHAALVTAPWDNDSPGTRVDRILDIVGWPQVARSIDEGQVTLQSATLGTSALTHLRSVTSSEFGELFMDRRGIVRFVQRLGLVNQTNRGTFGQGLGEHRYADIRFDLSDELIRNQITVSRADGQARTVEDADSIETYGTISYTRDGLLHDDDDLSLSAAQFLLSQYATDLLRITGVTITPRSDPDDLFPIVLPRELLDLLTVKLTPPGGGSDISQTLRIEAITHRISALKVWETEWELSPAYSNTCFFQLDGSCGLDNAALFY